MDKTRTLPPSVRGKVTSVLEFFVDKIKLFRNMLLLANNFDLVLQVQWWGESLPALIRPKELQIEDRTLQNIQSSESQYHCEKYDIRTSLELFKSYLKTCEVLELCVLEAVENFVIGSAFLRDLINLLNSHNEIVSLPVFDYLGEEIGEVIIHVNFLEKPKKKFEVKCNDNDQIPKNECLDKKSKRNCNIFSNLECDLSLAEKTLFYNQKHHQEKSCQELQPQINFCDITSSERTVNLDLSFKEKVMKPSLNQKKSQPLCEKSEPNFKSLPKIETLSDSSKVLCFTLSSQPPRSKVNNKNAKIKVTNKFSSNSVKCKSKQKFSCNQNKQNKKISARTLTSLDNFRKNQIEIKKEEQSSSTLLLSEKSKDSKVLPDYKQIDIQDLSSNDSSNKKVLDYLLGCEMSKDNEEKALNDFKKMSPSHNLVDSISQLCLVSDQNSPTSKSKFDAESSDNSKESYLNFDFNNPIERNYYEKFFLRSKSIADFEVAEFLNNPENSFKLGCSKLSESKEQKKSKPNCSRSYSEFSLVEEKMKKLEKKGYLDNNIKVNERAKGCARCKYYKKLSELDTIIESLKHFEQKMIMHEKNSQNIDMLLKKNQIVEDS